MRIGNRINFGELSTRTATGTTVVIAREASERAPCWHLLLLLRLRAPHLRTIARGLSIRAAEDVSFKMANPETLESK